MWNFFVAASSNTDSLIVSRGVTAFLGAQGGTIVGVQEFWPVWLVI
jgi:hypothetical protein